MSTLSTLRSKFNNDVSINKSFQQWNSSLVDQFLNQAYYQVQKDGNFDWSENETSSTLTYTSNEADLPSDFMVLSIVKAGTSTLSSTNKLSLVNNNADLTNTGSPSQYYLYGGKLGLDKVPTPAVTIYYKKQLPDMTDVVDSSFPDRFDTAIVKYAAYLAFSTYLPSDPRGQIRLQDYQQAFDSIFNYQIDDSSISFSYEK